MFRTYYFPFVTLLMACLLGGCGTTKSRLATTQLLLSDAVDRSIAKIDFSPLAGRRVYLDTKYIKTVKGLGFVNSDYIVSSLRQQMLAAGCYLEEEPDQAELIAEVRVGALGTDAHDVTYGIPASNALSSASSLVPNAPPIPMIPEISLVKKADEVAAAKIAVFAYHRETRQAYWQSGLSQTNSFAKDTWVFGAGPFQRGTIHDGTQFAGENLDLSLLAGASDDEAARRFKEYGQNRSFLQTQIVKDEPDKPQVKVQPASHKKPTKEPVKKPAESPPAAKSAAKPRDASAPTTKR